MFKKISIGILMALALPALAQEPTTPVAPKPTPAIRTEVRDLRQNVKNEIKDTRQNARQEIKDTRRAVKSEIKDLRQNLKAEVNNLRETARGTTAEKRDEVKALMEKRREEFKQKVEMKREEVKQKVAAKREDLKKKLEKIKDERKKQLVMRLDEQLDKINANRVGHFTENLDKVQKVLNNVSSRADKALAKGLNVTTVKTAILKAEAAINASKTAIEAQAGKTYALTIKIEATLRSDVGVARQTLEKDLKAVQETIKAAHDAVRSAAVALAQIPHVDEIKDETSTVPATPAAPAATTGTKTTVPAASGATSQ